MFVCKRFWFGVPIGVTLRLHIHPTERVVFHRFVGVGPGDICLIICARLLCFQQLVILQPVALK